MGCSASRSHTITAQADEEQPPPPPPPSNPCSSSSCHSSSLYSDPSSTPVSRTISLVHHPPLRKGDTTHLVSLTSTTYGSLLLIDPIQNPNSNPQDRPNRPSSSPDAKEPSSPDSVINTWELMEGLDDDFCFDVVQKPPTGSVPDSPIESPKKLSSFLLMDRYMDCDDRSVNKGFDSFNSLRSFETVEEQPDSKPLWKLLSEESLLAKMDPNVVSSYRRALDAKQLGFRDTKPKTVIKPSISVPNISLSSSGNQFCSPNSEDNKIVLYYTSLRGIRRTFEDCCSVRMILRGFRVCVDERDISMDADYRKELQSLLGGKTLSLPRVFVRGKCVGGADEIKQLHESGELAKLFEGFPVRDLGFFCESCGDARFMPCPNCNGSRKVFEEEEGESRRCPDCNENGLIRCPSCCS
ncbi:hypothetical protein U1Q18_013005 [Sarracenia purpurea var. burkii]